MGPIANQEVRGQRTKWSPRSQEHHGRELASDSNSSPPRLLQPRELFSVKRTNERLRHAFTIVRAVIPAGMTIPRWPDRSRQTKFNDLQDVVCKFVRPVDRLPGNDELRFSSGRRRGGARAGRPEPSPLAPVLAPPLPGVQISPLDAATPSSPVAVVTRGPNRLR